MDKYFDQRFGSQHKGVDHHCRVHMLRTWAIMSWALGGFCGVFWNGGCSPGYGHVKGKTCFCSKPVDGMEYQIFKIIWGTLMLRKLQHGVIGNFGFALPRQLRPRCSLERFCDALQVGWGLRSFCSLPPRLPQAWLEKKVYEIQKRACGLNWKCSFIPLQ